jgi:D-beta-D-heptose 7-phosphate kinase/D-beta-D-heptose 1-phosphate adenosyltransferase
MTQAEVLLKVVEKFQDTPVLVVGDLIVDHYIWGGVNRISPEAPVVVVDVNKEDKRPGGAGNVGHNLVELGARVHVCGVVGDDLEGRALTEQLESLGMQTGGVFVDRNRPTTVKTRVIAHAQQVVRVDRESRDILSAAFQESIGAEVREKLSTVGSVIISDYGKGAVTETLFTRVREAAQDGEAGITSVPVLVDPKAPNFSLYQGGTIIKPNRKEAEEASGVSISDRDSAIAAGRVLLEKWNSEFVLITLGEMGMVLVSALDSYPTPVEIDTVAQEVYDVSGAGDTVSAVFGLALASGAKPDIAAELANIAAGIVVSEVGTVPVRKEQLIERIRSECT